MRRDQADADGLAKAVRQEVAAADPAVAKATLEVIERVAGDFLRVAFSYGRSREHERLRGAGRLLPLPTTSRIVRRTR
jgi:hypothetical protein